MKKALNIISKICYIIAIILIIFFLSVTVISYFKHKELLLNPLAMVAPFYVVVKHLAICLLIPAIIFAVAGVIIKLYVKHNDLSITFYV